MTEPEIERPILKLPRGKKRRLELERTYLGSRRCYHYRVGVDVDGRDVYCRDCEAPLDPIEVLGRYASEESRLRDEWEKRRVEVDLLEKRSRAICPECKCNFAIRIEVRSADLQRFRNQERRRELLEGEPMKWQQLYEADGREMWLGESIQIDASLGLPARYVLTHAGKRQWTLKKSHPGLLSADDQRRKFDSLSDAKAFVEAREVAAIKEESDAKGAAAES